MFFVEGEFAGIQAGNIDLDGLELCLSRLTTRTRLFDLGCEAGNLRLTCLAT